MTTATVGVFVAYWPSQTDITATNYSSLVNYDSAQPMAAILSYVQSQTQVNLTVIDHAGAPHVRIGVNLIQFGAVAPPTPYAQLLS